MAETVKKPKAPAKPRGAAATIKATPEGATAAAPIKGRSASAKARTVTEMAAPSPTREQIAQLAHKYWAERGWKHGSAEQDWLRAEQELRGMAS